MKNAAQIHISNLSLEQATEIKKITKKLAGKAVSIYIEESEEEETLVLENEFVRMQDAVSAVCNAFDEDVEYLGEDVYNKRQAISAAKKYRKGGEKVQKLLDKYFKTLVALETAINDLPIKEKSK